MNLRSIPYVRLIIPLMMGILWYEWYPPNLYFGGISLMLMGAMVLFFARRRYAYQFRWWFGSCLFVFMVLAGLMRKAGHDERNHPKHFAALLEQVSSGFICGEVIDAPSRGKSLKIPVAVTALVDSNGRSFACNGHVLLFLRVDSTPAVVRYGDRIIVRTAIQPCTGPLNPDAFDYRNYLHHQNIHFQAFARNEDLQIVSSVGGYGCWRLAFYYRDGLLRKLQHYIPGQDEYGVVAALLVGYKNDLSEDIRTAYAQTGSMHALAISGTHVGILYTGLFLLLGQLPFRGRKGYLLKSLLVVFAIWCFALLTGATASVLRATVMFSFFLAGRAIRREASIWNILASSAFYLLLFNPDFMFDAGWQLSYTAVCGMVFFYPRLYKLTPVLPKFPDHALKMLLVGVAAQLGTLPLSLYYFHQFPCYFWLAGWVVVLGGAAFLWGGFVLVVLDTWIPPAAVWMGKGLYFLVHGMNACIQWIQHLPGSVIDGIWLPNWCAALLMGFVLAVSFLMARQKSGWLWLAILLLTTLLSGLAHRSLTRFRQQEMVIYYLKKGILIDYTKGFSRTSFSCNAPEQQVRFAAQLHRWKTGAREKTRLESHLPSPKDGYNPPFLSLGNQLMLIITDSTVMEPMLPIPVDMILVSQSRKITAEQILERFPCKMVVSTAEINAYQNERWENACVKIGIRFYSIRTQGAWTWKP
ncbi:MAG: ComEC family competence protein [Lewinellaceae bacterium]|nr:ComEC family competence protein [Lewinellaceae bacterium]